MTIQTQPIEPHKKTGLPVQVVPTFKVGDLVTESINGDSYPGVVVHATPKTVYVAHVDYKVVDVKPNDIPGYNGYGDSAGLEIDEASVKAAVAKGKDAGAKYVLHGNSHPSTGGSVSSRDAETYGPSFHRAGWRRPGGGFRLSSGASYRRDPHV
jgi:hypothetical protein